MVKAMSILKNVFITLWGKRVQTVLIFFIILVIVLFELTGLLIHSASKAAEGDTYRQIGVSIAINLKDGKNQTIDKNMLSHLISKEHVVGYDSYLECYCTPGNFHNVKIYTGLNPATQNEKADDPFSEIEKERDQIALAGGINVKFNDRFYKNQNELIQGHYPDQDNRGALVTQELAQANHLKIGDTLSVKGVGTNNSTDLKILGIYKTNLKMEVLDTNFMGEEVFRASPYNTIYTNYDILDALWNNDCPVTGLTVWIDSPQNIQTVMSDLSVDSMWSNFDIFNLTSLVYNEYAYQLEATNKFSEYVILLSLLFGAIILIIAMTFFANSYMYETGLYTILGMKKSLILYIQVLQSFFIAMMALLVSFSIIKIKYISVNSAAAVSCYDNGESDIKQNFHVSLTPEVCLYMTITLLILTVVATVIPMLVILHLKPREILAANEKG